MSDSIQHSGEEHGNTARELTSRMEPCALRTFTPTQAVLSRSSGIFHWTTDGRKLYDFTSGVLVANLGHNSRSWLKRFRKYMQWTCERCNEEASRDNRFVMAVPLTAYNAITPIEVDATHRLLTFLHRSPGARRLEQVMWAASGSEAIQKALWVALARDRGRPMILATRYGFHGKKGLANAVTGSEADPERDPRVRFISFPKAACQDVTDRDCEFDSTNYLNELAALKRDFGRQIGTLITEPYLGGGGSYHPPTGYLQLLHRFCRENDIILILDEVQSNFGRTGVPFAFEKYGIEPDIVVLGKGLGNGVPVAAAVGPAELFGSLAYGEASDTWSANPLSCAAVLATLDEYENGNALSRMTESSGIIERGLVRLKEFPFVAAIRGEAGGMVWGVETREHAGRSAPEWANAIVLGCYQGEMQGGEGIHLLGPLAKKVIRIAPPLVITPEEAAAAMSLMHRAVARLLA